MKGKLFFTLLTVVFSFVSGTSEAGLFDYFQRSSPTNQARTSQTNQQSSTALSLQPSGAYYNQLKTPQFQTEILGDANEPSADGGVGGGLSASFFCGGKDEAAAFHRLNYPAGTPTYFPNDLTGNQGTYQFIRIADRCRTEGGCGTLPPDHKYLVLGFPQTATNCHPVGTALTFDHPVWDTWDTIDADYVHTQGRNYIEDPGFLYGRYLIRMLSRDLGNAEQNPRANIHMGDLMGITYSSAMREDPGNPNTVSPHFLDIPYSADHLSWGFTCAAIAKSRLGYKANRRVNGLTGYSPGEPRELDDEHLAEYSSLLDFATASIGNGIFNRTYGNMNASNPTDQERMMKEIVVNVYAILQEMRLHIERPAPQSHPDDHQWYDFFSRDPVPVQDDPTLRDIHIMSCSVANGTFIDYQHDQSRICINSSIVEDCQGKRHSGSDAHYNVGNNCHPSYGHFDSTRGLVETRWQNPGYDLWAGEDGYWSASSASRDVPSDGYSPWVVASIAHQLVHAYFCRHLDHCRMNDHPSPESDWEETLGVLAQSLVYTSLCHGGYCADYFGMRQGQLIRSLNLGNYIPSYAEFQRHPGRFPYNRYYGAFVGTYIRGANAGRRFYYENDCRGYGRLFLGPFCVDMFNISRNLELGDPEEARLLAHYYSEAPFLTPPPQMSIDGQPAVPFAYRGESGPGSNQR